MADIVAGDSSDLPSDKQEETKLNFQSFEGRLK